MTAGSKFQSFDTAFEECGCCEVAFSGHQDLLILDHRYTREVWLLIQRKVYLNLPPKRIRGEKPCLTRAVEIGVSQSQNPRGCRGRVRVSP